MRFLKSKRGIVLLATLVVAAASAIGAYAYFGATGSGTVSGTAGHVTDWGVNGGSLTGSFYPVKLADLPTGAIQVTGAKITNNGDGPQRLNEIDATLSTTTDTKPDDPPCTAADWQFYSADPSWSIPSGGQTATIQPAADLASSAIYTIDNLYVALVDTGLDQNNCQDQQVTVHFAAK